jgi:hypothetical protein
MTYPAPPARSGMPTWAKWTMFGCGGCLLVTVLGFGGCMLAAWRMLGMKSYDASRKPDVPLTATAGQLLPPRVGPFVRRKVNRLGAGWQGAYVSNDGKQVELKVEQTGQMRQSGRSPAGGGAGQNQPPNVNTGFRMSMKIADQQMELVIWAKPNWTYTVQSPDMVAVKFADAYRPAVGGGR